MQGIARGTDRQSARSSKLTGSRNLSSSLDGLRRLQKARPTLAVAPTPVKAALAPTKGSSSPPVSPLLRFEEEEAAAGAKALCN